LYGSYGLKERPSRVRADAKGIRSLSCRVVSTAIGMDAR
jgi:hypothetical protein